jgi:hypothetical protein
MPSNILAYEWPLKSTIHIVYETGDEHIHEMSLGRKGTWHDDDITRMTGAPELEDAILTGASWQDGRTQQIAYASAINDNGHIYELVMYQDHPWSLEDPMLQPIDAAPADGFALAAYDWKQAGTKQLVYSGRDGHIHELSASVAGFWRYTDLTKVTSAPLADNSLLAAYAWEGGNTKQVVYVGEDGHIHELMSGVDGRWRHTDLMAETGAPLAGDVALAGYAWEYGKTKQVVYTGSDGDVYELAFRQDSRWSFVDLTSLTGAPLAVGSALAAFAWETGFSKQVVYVDRNHHLYQLQMSLQETWKHIDLTQKLGLPESSQDVLTTHEWTPEFAQHIAYLDTAENPHIHSLLLKHGEDWKHTDVTSLTGSQPIV